MNFGCRDRESCVLRLATALLQNEVGGADVGPDTCRERNGQRLMLAGGADAAGLSVERVGDLVDVSAPAVVPQPSCFLDTPGTCAQRLVVIAHDAEVSL